MFGGLTKSASRLALVAAAGVLSTGAYAADLGGDCCADLEERVAELEATTARKGNRKVSLTISGQVNRGIMYYNDGGKSNAFFGLDNTQSSTRFGFSGNAKITPTLTAGFTIVIDVADTGRMVGANQQNEDGGSLRGLNCVVSPAAIPAGGGNTPATNCRNNTNGDHLLRMRNAFWYLESSTVGRIQVGRMATSSSQGVLDLGGVSVVAATGEGCVGTSLIFRDSNGLLSSTARQVGTYSLGCAHPGYRAEAVQYISPTFAGFTFSASIGEAAKAETSNDNNTLNRREALGVNYGADLKYAGEFSGVRIAAALGWEKTKANDDDGVSYNSDYTQWGASLSLLHVPTGLFAQGWYSSARSAPFDSSCGANTTGVVTAPLTCSAFVGGTGESTTSTTWHIQAGIKQNFFGIGATSIYGEYAKFNNWGQANTATFAGGVTSAPIIGDKLTMYGLGVVQNIDAAAMELYLGWRNFKVTDDLYAVATTNGVVNGSLKPIDVVAAGARIKF